jgi:hypothetical protein
MHTLDKQQSAETSDTRPGRLRRSRARIATVLVSVAFVIAGAGAPAFATTTDPLGGAGDSFFTTLQGYLTSVLVPAVIALALIGVAVSMLLKWGKKAAKSA